ncbi:MAG: DUF4179 domain-containing protein [Ruminococcaceae bacterium]|nr:DUF4179 domain-containing protein [Oscillospiraceae bacterium]
MRDTEERMAQMKRRVDALEKKRRRRIAAASAAACLLAVVGASLAMPGWIERLPAAALPNGAAASLFAEHAALGYLVIGILAFLLGVSVTILCFRMAMRSRSGRGEAHDRGD